MKKILSIALAVTMLLGCAGSLAENTKHERVYVTAAADGTVKSVTDNIRLENADALDEIADATILTDLVNLSGKETFALDGETLTWQANGRDIVYQGTSEKTPSVLPQVTLTLDGEEISAESLKEKTGKASIEVNYQAEGNLPAVAVTMLLLPEEGVTNLKTENATILSEMGRQVLVGWAVPGADRDLELPDTFSATFQADHADLSWMMTFVTSDPVSKVCAEIENRVDMNAHLELDEAEALLIALRDGTALPETTGKTKEIAPKITGLNDALTELDDGAKTLSGGAKELKDGASDLKDGAKTLSEGAASLDDGAAQVKDGAAQVSQGAQSLAAGCTEADTGAASLETGLNQLVENNDTLNAGAQMLFASVLAAANQQMAAAGLDAAGITLPELTAENYAAVLDAALAQLNPETLPGAAMADGNETITAALAAAQAAYDALSSLKDQLDQINTFVQGVATYTAGVAQASAGAASLKAGLVTLNDGAAALKDGAGKVADGAKTLAEGTTTLKEGASDLADGTAKLYDGAAALADGAQTLQETGTGKLKETLLDAEKEAAEKLLPYVQEDLSKALRIYEETRDNAKNAGYDLRPEGMETVTVYIIRTDLQ